MCSPVACVRCGALHDWNPMFFPPLCLRCARIELADGTFDEDDD